MATADSTYIRTALDALREQLRLTSSHVADEVALSEPRIVHVQARVEVDFAYQPAFVDKVLAPAKPLATDRPSSAAVDEILKAEFEAARALLALRPPFDVSRGLQPFPDQYKADIPERSLVYRHLCADCSGKKQVRCPKCKGHRHHTCQACSGHGNRECHDCRGSGMVTLRSESTTCPTCHGSRRLPCHACDRSGKIACRHCKGNGKVECKPCVGRGFTRVQRTMTVMVATSPSLHVQSGPRHFAEAAITHFGGLRDLESGVGHLTETRQLHGCVRYALTIPLVTVNASLRSATGQCVVAGRVPRLVISGDFLEDSLADQFDRLQQVVRSGTSLLVDAKALRSALLHFLHAPTNRACVSEAGAVVPGVSPAYAVRARQLVGEALGQVFSGTLLRYMVAGLIVAPFVYLLAHRIFGLSPADALPYGAVPPLLAYVSAVVSNRLTLRSLTSDPAFQASLKQAADSR